MNNILLVISSPRGAASYSTKVARSLVDEVTRGHPNARVVVRDLTDQPLPHIGADFVAGLGTPAESRTPAQRAAVALADEITGEVFAADVIIIASPMINFGVASTLKTWFDYLLRAGVTFRYSEKGPEGLVTGKKAYLVQARGGVYSQGPMQAANFQEPYLKQLLGFIGITDVETVAVEGVAFGPEVAEKAFAAALAKVSVVRSSNFAR